MEPISTILTALTAGAAAAGKDVAGKAVKDAYAGLKDLILHKFGGKADVKNALKQVEKKPESDGRKSVLKEELETAEAGQDKEVLGLAQALLDLLKEQGPARQSRLHGDGAIAQGNGATAVGKRGVNVGGDVTGNIVTGDGNVLLTGGKGRSDGKE